MKNDREIESKARGKFFATNLARFDLCRWINDPILSNDPEHITSNRQLFDI